MDHTIKKILKSNQVDGIFHTHVSLCRPKGKFQFNRQTLEEFWDSYCTIMKSNPDYITGIAEKSQQYLPVLADIDLKIRDNGEQIDDALYTEDQLKAVVEIYQSTLRQIVDNLSDNDLTCVCLEKKMYQQSKNDNVYFKHGFHLHFPYIFLNKVDQETQLIPRIQQAIGDLKLFKEITEDSASVIDKVCCKVPWLLYGSRKSEEHQPYRVTKIYDSELNIINLEKAFKNYQIFDQKEQLIQIRGKIEHYLPRILSIIPYGRSTKEIKRGITSPIKEKLKKEQRNVSTSNHKLGVEESLAVARRLLPMISSFRAEDRNEWMNIGWILYNISEGNPDGLELWCEFSSRCEEKYDENVCIYQWERMTKRDIGLGTLRHYASVDNPVEYKKYKEEQTNKYVLESLDGSHNDVAKALFADYSDEFVCASVSNRIWFQFSNHRWEQIEEGVFLREKISGRIVNRYIEMAKKLYDEMKGGQDKAREAMTQARIKAVNKMIANLKSAPYKSNVMKEAIEVFYDPKFREKLDADPYLIAFKNGVYDLRMNYFRPGRPEDYLSKNMPINYVDFSEDDEKVHDVSTFLEQVFPDKSVRNYFLDVSSDIFVGGNHEKIVLFWTGEGDNGKSVTQLFFELMMGKLAIKLNTNIITGKKPSAGAAFADLARAGGGVRWAVLEEPDADEMINTGIFKHMSGNDSFYARDLFERGKDGREIKPLFKLVFICLAEGTKVCLPQGISLSIEKLKENTSLLGYDISKDLIRNIKQEHLLEKGTHNCFKMTLQDGRTITCTPDHKFLTWNGEWIKACDIKEDTSLRVTIEYPNCDDMFEQSNYRLFNYDLNLFENRCKIMALCRVIGWVYKNKYNEIYNPNLISDLKLLGDKYISILEKVKSLDIPSFLYSCPKFMLREFLSVYLNPYLNLESNVVVLSCNDPEINLQKLLQIFDINMDNMKMKGDDVIKYIENIGIRYDNDSSARLCLLSTLMKYKKFTGKDYKDFAEESTIDILLKKDKIENNPCFKLKVVSIVESDKHPVYDIVAEEPYSNFIANGIVTHNCNKLPRMKAADKAVWNRVRVIPFEATFCRPDNPAPESYEEQLRQKRFPMDKQFGKKIPNLVEAFAWYLLQHRLKIMNSPRVEPEKVRSATEIYRKQNDIYRQFVDESIAEDKDKWISLVELYNLFKEWFKDSLPGHSVPVKNEIEEYFSKIWGTPDSGKKWKGYRQRTIQDDIDSGEAIVLTEEDLVSYEEKKEQ